MRILAITDVHGSWNAQKMVNSQIQKHTPHLVVCCGDITQFGPPEWATEFLNAISLKTLAIPGNCDPRGVLEAIEDSQAIPLHGRSVDVSDRRFVGLGGSSPTPFGTPFELSETEIYQTLHGIMSEGAALVSHSPAKGHLDSTASVSYLGSSSIAKIVSEFSPPLVISGHIHEARGVEKEGETTYVNPGPASRGYAAIIDLNEDIEVDLIRE